MSGKPNSIRHCPMERLTSIISLLMVSSKEESGIINTPSWHLSSCYHFNAWPNYFASHHTFACNIFTSVDVFTSNRSLWLALNRQFQKIPSDQPRKDQIQTRCVTSISHQGHLNTLDAAPTQTEERLSSQANETQEKKEEQKSIWPLNVQFGTIAGWLFHYKIVLILHEISILALGLVTIPSSLSLFLSFLAIDILIDKLLAHAGIRASDLWCRKLLLCQLRRTHCPVLLLNKKIMAKFFIPGLETTTCHRSVWWKERHLEK